MSEHILIVDDSDQNLYYLQALLTGHGYRISQARHGVEALTLARRDLPALIVSDLLMPVMDGYTLLRHWRADELLRDQPFIVYTATYTAPEDERLALDLGADAFILKPAEPETFLSSIQRVLKQGHSSRNPGAPRKSSAHEAPESGVFKAYSDTLIRKLEEKMLQLEQANEALRRDIEERERVEEALRRSQRLEVVGRLTGGLAHDFNNFLQVILINSEILRESRGLDTELEPAVEQIEHAAANAGDLVRRLLTFAGRQALQPVPTDLNALIQGTRRLIELAIGKQVRLDLDLGEDLPETRVDQGQMESALMNLSLNARDAMASGGVLHLSTRTVDVTDQETLSTQPLRAGRYVTVAVEDSGDGIDSQLQSRVFEPFFTTKRDGSGSGLGLSMVYGFIKQSGGDVVFDSRPGDGTTVTLYLPVTTH
jgi:signal transduction histidine kinase